MCKRKQTANALPGRHSRALLCFQLLVQKGKRKIRDKIVVFPTFFFFLLGKKKKRSCGSVINGEWQGFLVAGMGIPWSLASSSCCPGSVPMRKSALLILDLSQEVVVKLQREKNKQRDRMENWNGREPVVWKRRSSPPVARGKNAFTSLHEELFSVLEIIAVLLLCFAHRPGRCRLADFRAEIDRPRI